MICVLLTSSLRERFRILSGLVQDGAQSAVARRIVTGPAVSSASLSDAVRVFLEIIQALPVVVDPPGKDCYATIEHTIKHGGDCASKSVALAALIRALADYRGVPAMQIALVWEHRAGGPTDHVRVDLGGVVYDPLRAVPVGSRAVSWVPEWSKSVSV